MTITIVNKEQNSADRTYISFSLSSTHYYSHFIEVFIFCFLRTRKEWKRIELIIIWLIKKHNFACKYRAHNLFRLQRSVFIFMVIPDSIDLQKSEQSCIYGIYYLSEFLWCPYKFYCASNAGSFFVPILINNFVCWIWLWNMLVMYCRRLLGKY